MRSQGRTLFQVFKYTIYVLLTVNIGLFGAEEYNAAKLQFPDGIAPGDLIEAFASTIDTAAWVVLLLLFEIETYVLEDEQCTKPTTLSLHAARVLCYLVIVYAFYGYAANLAFTHGVTALPDVTSLCALVSDGWSDRWSYAVDLDEYVEITSANCASLSAQGSFLRFDTMPAAVDLPGLVDIQRLAWTDVINSGVWLLVVLLLEIDVRLQERNRYEGAALIASLAMKVPLYLTLFLAAVYWGVKGDFVDFWDAFLWLVAFAFIEMNILEWRREERRLRRVEDEFD